jgi:Tol biopolymer transport system component
MKSRLLVPFGAAALALLFTGPSAYATFPGRNGKIVFVSDRSGSWQLHTIDPDGRNMTQITSMPATDYDNWTPSFSPDGKRIAFCYGTGISSEVAFTEIYVINADGTGLKQLTHDGGGDCFPHWSPDGSHIAFTGSFPPAGSLAVMHSDGTDERLLLTTPDGQSIVFESQFGGLVSAVWIMDSNGTHPRRLTPAPLEAYPIDVSPDGRQILINNHFNTVIPSSTFVMDIDGKNRKRIFTPFENAHEGPVGYSPDGKKFIFYSDRSNLPFTFDILTINADGSDLKRIAAAVASCPNTGNCVGASWSPKPGK